MLGVEFDTRSSLFHFLLRWASCPTGLARCLGARERRRIVMACSDPSTAIINFIARSPLSAGESMDFRPWSYLFSLRTRYFIGVSLNVFTTKVSIIVVPPSEVCWQDCNETPGVNAEDTVCT